MDWRPISIARKDMSPRLLCVAGCEPAVGRWLEGIGWSYLEAESMPDEQSWDLYAEMRKRGEIEWYPTHWMPLPPPPERT